MSITCIEKLKTEQQSQIFAKFIKENSELKSIYDIQTFIKPIQELLGVIEIDIREIDTSSYHKQLECENIGFNFLLLKLENNKSIVFKEFQEKLKEQQNILLCHID